MSLNPVYLWNPQNFPDPQAMLPDGFDAAHRIVSEWADQPLPQGADTSAFDKLAGYIAEAARSGKASADFKAAYADIGTQIAEQLKSRAILELYGHHLELMPIASALCFTTPTATCCCPRPGIPRPRNPRRNYGIAENFLLPLFMEKYSYAANFIRLLLDKLTAKTPFPALQALPSSQISSKSKFLRRWAI